MTWRPISPPRRPGLIRCGSCELVVPHEYNRVRGWTQAGSGWAISYRCADCSQRGAVPAAKPPLPRPAMPRGAPRERIGATVAAWDSLPDAEPDAWPDIPAEAEGQVSD